LENELNQVHKIKRKYQTYLSNLIWKHFTSNAFTMRKSAKNNNHRFRRFREQLLAET